MSETRIPDAPPVVGSFQLALRFVLEAAALVAIGGWARHVVGSGVLGWVAALAMPAVVAAVWGVFAVPGDPTRGGKVPVPVSGWLRIGIEMAVFLGAGAALVSMEWWRWFDPFIGGFVVHHVGTRQRIVWLLR